MRHARLLILFLLLCLAPLATTYGQCSATPAPTATPVPSYSSIVLGTAPGNLLAYWQLNETSGTTAADSSGHSRDGTYSGVTLNATTFLDGSPAGSWDGVNDFANVYSSGLSSAFNGSEGTLLAWIRVANSGVWTDATTRYFGRISVNANNDIAFIKRSTSNQLQLDYRAGGTLKFVLPGTTSTSFLVVATTWSASANEARFYINGSQSGSTQTGLGVWTGALASAGVVLGASSTSGGSAFYGSIAHVVLWDTPLNSTQIANLATVPTPVTPTPTGSATPCPTATPTNTPYFYIEMTTPAGEPARVERSVSIGQVPIILLLSVLLLTIWAFRFWDRIAARPTRQKGAPTNAKQTPQ